MPFVSRTRAIFRSAEFGFLGVIVDTRVQTPRFCGAPWSAGVFVFSRLDVRPLRINWFTVGMSPFGIEKVVYKRKVRQGAGPQPNQGGMVAKMHGFAPFQTQTDAPLKQTATPQHLTPDHPGTLRTCSK